MNDSHTHIDRGPAPPSELVAQARAAGVQRILAIGMDSESCRAALAAADAHEEVFAAVGRHPNLATAYDAAVTADAVAVVPWTDRDADIHDVLAQLSPKDRQTLLLAGWEGLVGEQLAAVLGMTRGAADAALSRARSRLRDAWARTEATG